MNVVVLAGGACVALLGLVALWAAKRWTAPLWALGVLLAISPLALAKVPALGNDTVFKAGMAALIVMLWVRLGVRVRWPVALMSLGVLWALMISATHLVPQISVDSGLAFKSFAGFGLTLAALMVRWRREHLPAVLRVLVTLPILSLVIGVLLQGAGIWQIVQDGRLGGALIGPHLALLSVAAAFAAATGLLVLGARRWALWLLVDCGIAFLTLTRGALIAAGILLVALGVWTVAARRTAAPSTLRAARLVFWGSVGAALVALPMILARNTGNAYEGSFNTSGREQAWPFYIGLSADSPWFGRGLGYANIANALLHPLGVQTEFESPHNEYIHLWVDGGLLLAVPFFAGLIALGLLVARITGQRLLITAILAGTLAYSFVDNNFSTPQFDVVFGLLMAALLGYSRSHAAEAEAAEVAVEELPRRRVLQRT